MPEENNNQPATPPINYEEHLDWFRVFVFIILPIQFIGNLYEFFQCIYDFNEYINTFFYIFSFKCQTALFYRVFSPFLS